MFPFPARGKSQTAPAAANEKLRWYQFRLRTLMFGMFLASLAMSCFAVRMQRAKEQAAAARELGKFQGAFIYYDCQVENNLGLGLERENIPRGPAWFRRLVGDDFFNNVTGIGAGATDIADENLALLRAFPKLRYAVLERTKVTDDGLKHLESLAHLEGLSLDYLKISDAGLAHLAPLTGIRWLSLDATNVAGPGLAHLKNWTKLESLYLAYTPIRDEELVRMQQFPALQCLTLGGTRISDAGIQHLKGLHQLREISLWNTRVTDAGLRDLQAALPDCKIEQ
jgi:hypothetical protein